MMTRRRSKAVSLVPGDVYLALVDLGVDVDRQTTNEAWARCPAHNDRKPSWSVNLDTGEHHCFSCGWSGDFSMLVKRLRGGDDDEAHEWIRKRGGFDRARRRFRGESGFVAEKAVPITEADLALFIRPPRYALEAKDVTTEACEAFGVLYDPDTERWVFPVRDPFTGKLRGWQEKGKRIFLNRPDHLVKKDTLFGWDVFRRHQGDVAILVESPLDAIKIWGYGINGAVSSYGAKVADDQLNLIVESADHLIVAMDNDEAGETSAEQIRERLFGRIRLEFINYQHAVYGDDPGSLSEGELIWALEHTTNGVVTRF